MSGGFDPEAFKAQQKEEMYTENKAMMKELLGEMTKLLKDKQSAQSSALINLDTELPVREREEDKVTVLADPIRRENLNQPESVERPVWAKQMAKTMARVQMMMKEKGIATPADYADLTLDEEDDPLPSKFKFPNMKKYSGIDDAHLHLKQYATYMKATGLSKAQITKQFPMSLEGTPIR